MLPPALSPSPNVSVSVFVFVAAFHCRHRAQVRVTLLEARTRIGGRVHTDRRTFGHAVELGAQFIHGAAQNPLSAVANSFGLVRVCAWSAICCERVWVGGVG